MIEGFKIEPDEDGWYVLIEGDFVNEVTQYLNDESCCIRIRLGDTEGLQNAAAELAMWMAEGRAMAATYVPTPAQLGPEYARDAYAPDDPKRFAFEDGA